MDGSANPFLPWYDGNLSTWDGSPVRTRPGARFPKWAYLVRISPGRPGEPIIEIDEDSDPTYLAAFARTAVERLRKFRGHEIAEDDDFGAALNWFDDVTESGDLGDLEEALHALYEWGDRRRVCIS